MIIAILVFVMLSSSSQLSAAIGIDQEIKSLGFQLTNSSPVDFKLPNLQGQEVQLSEFKGRWILLNFWATWCGPCIMEMPTLESLYQELKDQNLKVIGISVDQSSSDSVQKFITKKDISFLILHDQNSRVGSLYQASAIPSVYLISPDWRLVGIFRGAKSWESGEVLQTMKRLLQHKEVAEDLSKYSTIDSQKSDQLKLPDDLVPPTLKFEGPKLPIKLGQEVVFKVSINWVGDPRKYLAKVPRVKLPDGVEVKNVSSYTNSVAGRYVLNYQYPITFRQEGTYHIGPVTLSFQAMSGGAEQFSRHPGIDVEVKSRWSKNFLIVGGALILLCVIVLALFFLRKRKVDSLENVEEEVAWEAELQQIKKCKMEGDIKEYSVQLLKLNKQLASSKGDKCQKIDTLLEKIKFSGIILSDQELRTYEKRVENEFIKEDV